MFLVSGQELDSIFLFERALHYGDGLFETIAVKNKQPEYWQAHMERLLKGSEQLFIPAPNLQNLRANVDKLINKSQEQRCVIKIIYTRGQGCRGYKIPENIQPTEIIALYPWPNYPEINASEGVQVRVCTTWISRNERLAGIKHLNRLEQILARAEWQDDNIQEGLMLDEYGNVIEGTMSNLFIVKEGVLITPELRYAGIAGVMREVILAHANKNNWPCKITSLKLSEIMDADELFICNSILGIWPIRRLEEQSFPIGKHTRFLQQLITE